MRRTLKRAATRSSTASSVLLRPFSPRSAFSVDRETGSGVQHVGELGPDHVFALANRLLDRLLDSDGQRLGIRGVEPGVELEVALIPGEKPRERLYPAHLTQLYLPQDSVLEADRAVLDARDDRERSPPRVQGEHPQQSSHPEFPDRAVDPGALPLRLRLTRVLHECSDSFIAGLRTELDPHGSNSALCLDVAGDRSLDLELARR